MLQFLSRFIVGGASSVWGYAVIILSFLGGLVAIWRNGKKVQAAEDNLRRLEASRKEQERINNAIRAGDKVVADHLNGSNPVESDGLRKPGQAQPKLDRWQRD